MKFIQPLVYWELKNKTSIRNRKKTKIPKRTSAQKEKIRRSCRQVYLKYKDLV